MPDRFRLRRPPSPEETEARLQRVLERTREKCRKVSDMCMKAVVASDIEQDPGDEPPQQTA